MGHLARVLNTLLVEHIRGLLPSLRNKIGALKQCVLAEFMTALCCGVVFVACGPSCCSTTPGSSRVQPNASTTEEQSSTYRRKPTMYCSSDPQQIFDWLVSTPPLPTYRGRRCRAPPRAEHVRRCAARQLLRCPRRPAAHNPGLVLQPVQVRGMIRTAGLQGWLLLAILLLKSP